MKILAISASPNKAGNTVVILEKVLQAAREAGAETDLFSVAGRTVLPCTACQACHKTGECVIDDGLKDLYPLMDEADGIVFGTPIYFWNMTAQAKCIMDRSLVFTHREKGLENKVAAVVTVANSLRLADAMKDYA